MERSEAIRDVRARIEGLLVPDDAHQAHAAVAAALREGGWQVRREVRVATRGDGSGGRVDIVAQREEWLAGIEVDRQRPRRKSVAKLRTRDWIRVIALRDPDPDSDLPPPDDIVVISLRSESFAGWEEHER